MADNVVTKKVTVEALAKLEVDDLGLDKIDHQVLGSIVEKFSGGPVGLDTLAASISEDPDTIEDVCEPYLLQLGFLERTPRGRVATPRAYQHLGVEYPRQVIGSEEPFLGAAGQSPPSGLVSPGFLRPLLVFGEPGLYDPLQVALSQQRAVQDGAQHPVEDIVRNDLLGPTCRMAVQAGVVEAKQEHRPDRVDPLALVDLDSQVLSIACAESDRPGLQVVQDVTEYIVLVDVRLGLGEDTAETLPARACDLEAACLIRLQDTLRPKLQGDWLQRAARLVQDGQIVLVDGVEKGRSAEPADELRTLPAIRGEPVQDLEGLSDDEAEPASGKHVLHRRAGVYLLSARPMETQSRDTFHPALEEVSELIEEVRQVRVVAELDRGKGTGLLGMKGRLGACPRR